MTDNEFDLYLQDLADAPPPGELGSEFTPWRSAMNRILWGTVWTTLVFRLLYLDTILPSIGHGMLLQELLTEYDLIDTAVIQPRGIVSFHVFTSFQW